jgi:Ca-activated chloride channel homolog
VIYHLRPTCATIAVLLITAWPTHPPLVHAQDSRPTFKTGVAVVPITAIVRDPKNRVVRGLARNDFDVLENSQPRPIVDFRSTDSAPLSVALLFDTSGSMRGPNLERGKAVVNALLATLNPAADEVALFTFDKRLRQQTPFTNDVQRVWKAADNTDAWGLTSLYDAIADTAKRSATRQHPRRAVIVVTDGLDTSSTLTPSQVSGIASSIDVPIYIVAVMAPGWSAEGDEQDGGLSYLAYWTGGDVTRVTTSEATGRAVGALMAELRQQYFLAIESAAASGWHRLEVKTKRRDLTVRARGGYFAAPGRAGLGG